MYSTSWRVLLAVVSWNALAWAHEPLSSKYMYELGLYGLYATSSFKSFDLEAPRLNFPRWNEETCSQGYYAIAQKGKIVSNSGPSILDARGELVWTDDRYGVVFNLQIQTYKGEDYLTFWASPTGSSHGYGRGTYYMLDSSYRVFRKFDALGDGLRGDLHEFAITEHGTVMFTVYDSVPADLSSLGGPERGWVLDCHIQEIDIETGKLIFDWSVFEHVAIDNTLLLLVDEDRGLSPESAFDFFHLNSIDRDGQGNYIISGRHTSAIYCVSPDGQVLWTLGGTRSDFTDLSNGQATNFMYQHHVRLHANNTLSVFDNALSERSGLTSTVPYSRGLLLQLNVKAMTVRLVQEYRDSQRQHAASSQGSMQVMDDRVVVGFGWLPFITEFTLDGSVICDVELAPWIAARWGLVTTYRAFKTKQWVGKPKSLPSIYLDPADEQIFVSWNGATEVDRWVLQGAEWEDLEAASDGNTDNVFGDLGELKKERFEEHFDIDDDMPSYLRVVALDRHGHVLQRSAMVDRHEGNAPDHLLQDLALGLCFSALIDPGAHYIRSGAAHAAHSVSRFLAVTHNRLRLILEGRTRGVNMNLDYRDVHERRRPRGGRRSAWASWWDWNNAKVREIEFLTLPDDDSEDETALI
ncbi:Arylsulfotransferase-domain-containing protein [Xylariaceae sp. FL0255]|nr:Arylsulfotransferase-domain-containing protein [Xylariaceae sp. FL0255]